MEFKFGNRTIQNQCFLKILHCFSEPESEPNQCKFIPIYGMVSIFMLNDWLKYLKLI